MATGAFNSTFNVQRSTFGIQQLDGVSLCFFKAERELKQ
jgi:hypothetical protein